MSEVFGDDFPDAYASTALSAEAAARQRVESATAELVAQSALRQALEDGTAREIRKRARLRIPEVARFLGVEPSTVSRWERGLRVPGQSAAIAYHRLLSRLNGGSL